MNYHQPSSCPNTLASEPLAVLDAVAIVVRELRRSRLLLFLSVAVTTLGFLGARAAQAQNIINYPSGFAGSGSQLWLENASKLSGSSIQLTAIGQTSAANNVWYKTPVNVQAFTTSFTWTAQCPASPALCGDGMGFMIISDPNATPTGYTYSGNSGAQFSWSRCTGSQNTNCPAIKSVLVKFDLYNNETGSEGNSTGFYSGGVYPQAPNNPQSDMTSAGINMQSGHLMRATLSYNGSVLTEALTDTVTGSTYTNTYSVNIPSLVAGNVAYVGFGAGTGAATATQNLQSWTYSASSMSQAAPPTFSPAAGTYASSQSVQLTSTSSGSVICYNTTGSPQVSSSNGCTSGTLYTGPVTVSSGETLYAVAGGSGYAGSSVASATYVIQPAAAASAASVINYPNGFAGSSGQVWLENYASLSGSEIHLVPSVVHNGSNAWFKTPENIQAFTTTFTFHVDCSSQPSNCGDGLGFMIICACSGGNPTYNPSIGHPGYTYSGFSGGQFSWSQCEIPLAPAGSYCFNNGTNGDTGSDLTQLPDAILVKFDLYNNVTGVPSGNFTGYYTDGEYPQAPQNPQYDMSGSGIKMQSGDLFRATLSYDGTTLTETLTDTVTNATYTHSYAANIPGAITANTGFVGFGGGTGAATDDVYIDSWTYTVK